MCGIDELEVDLQIYFWCIPRNYYSHRLKSFQNHRLKSFQNLEYLGIGCSALENDDPAVSLPHATLDTHFLEAPEFLLEQLRSTQDTQLTATVTPDWKHYHLLASLAPQSRT